MLLVGLEELQCTYQAYATKSDSSSLPSDTDSKPKKESEREIREQYQLMYCQFSHCSPEKLRKLHKVSNV